jgi:diacylglycerol kinase (ATP)
MTKANRILIAANPKSGSSNRSDKVAQLSDQLGKNGFAVETFTDLSDFAKAATEAWQVNQLHCVVAAGGDGTVCAVAERLPPPIPIGIFPLGTENLLAKQFRLTADPENAAAIISARNLKVLDAGHANGRLFLIMASVGFDAAVVNLVHSNRRGHIRKWNYAWPIIKTVMSYRFPKFTMKATLIATPVADLTACVKQEIEVEGHWLFVFNVARYAGGLDFHSQADPSDGLLNACSFKRRGVLRALYYLSRIWSATLPTCLDYRVDRIIKMTITAPKATGFQVDGDYGGALPLVIESIPKRVTIIQSIVSSNAA